MQNKIDNKISQTAGIKYVFTRKNVKNINFRIKSDGIVYISAPYSTNKEFVEDYLSRNKEKFLSKIEKISALSESENNVPEYMCFLGRRYKIIYIFQNYEYAEIKGNNFVISTELKHTLENITLIIKNWQLKQCMGMYNKINKEVYTDFRKHGYEVPLARIYIKDMTSRWGSCNYVKGKISVNLRLCEYDRECIYSVFYHEYMHFKHQNHSKEFYKELYSIFPEYMECNNKLKNNH